MHVPLFFSLQWQIDSKFPFQYNFDNSYCQYFFKVKNA
ncbi:hypothetical protein J577_0286 [Acinetobacter sp. 263903-1]|nr:hypothetical protein J546_0081 [Acinetobacter sp. 1461402]EXB73382.1 hypothetical protein J550_0643 [Acinetobacter sp. 230853]KCX39553.1 hypothetical protein J577_0286 [Acinetobacter sp. 263903-1]